MVDEMLSVLHDKESDGFYRRLAASVPKDITFEALSLVRRAVNEGKIRKSRGALVVAIVKRAYTDRGIAGVLAGLLTAGALSPTASACYVRSRWPRQRP